MSRYSLLIAVAGLFVFAGCENKKTEPVATHTEEPQPLSTMDTAGSAPPADVRPSYNVQPAPPPNSSPPPSTISGSSAANDEVMAPQVPPASKKAGRTYVVKKGDTLSEISQKLYGDSTKWQKIYNANKNRIKDPKKLQVGTKLIIP